MSRSAEELVARTTPTLQHITDCPRCGKNVQQAYVYLVVDYGYVCLACWRHRGRWALGLVGRVRADALEEVG